MNRFSRRRTLIEHNGKYVAVIPTGIFEVIPQDDNLDLEHLEHELESMGRIAMESD